MTKLYDLELKEYFAVCTMEINNRSEQYLTKQIAKLLHRIERILVPSNSIQNSNIPIKLGYLLSRVKNGEFFENCDESNSDVISCSHDTKHQSEIVNLKRRKSERFAASASKNPKEEFVPRKVIWNTLQDILISTILEETGLEVLPEKIESEIEDERSAQEEVVVKHKSKIKIKSLQVGYLISCSFYSFHSNSNKHMCL